MNEYMVIEIVEGENVFRTYYDSLEEARDRQESIDCNSGYETVTALVYVYKSLNEEQLDCMTVVVDEYYVYGMSENALGFNQFCGELGSRYECDGRLECHVGKLIDMTTISKGLYQAILERCSE